MTNSSRDSVRAIVIGATGYVGGELLRLIFGHPELTIGAAVSSSRAGDTIASLYPALAPQAGNQVFATLDDAMALIHEGGPVAIFSAAPHGASAATIQRLLDCASEAGTQAHAVDVSADFRYPTADGFAAVYGTEHAAPGLLDNFVCAVPEHLDDHAGKHIGHPGCFATAILLATVPLYAHALVGDDVFVSAITGSTGSGRSPSAGTHHPERHSNLYAYKVLEHRHTPEIENLIRSATGRTANIRFIPHSGPFARGIYATVQAPLSAAHTADDIRSLFSDYYAASPFVRTVDGTPRLKNVVASNYCHIGLGVQDDTVAVTCAIDNLVKGAAGGAMQWMNRLLSWPEETGLTAPSPGWT